MTDPKIFKRWYEGPQEALHCTQGGYVINGDHIDYWRQRAEKAEAELAKLRGGE